jgi:hypothetical protein
MSLSPATSVFSSLQVCAPFPVVDKHHNLSLLKINVEDLTMREKWRRLNPPYSRYEVSNTGYIRNRTSHHIITQHWNKNGYLFSTLYTDEPRIINGRRRYSRTAFISRLVSTVWLPPRPPGKQLHHRDDNKLNNAASNLRWVTQSKNIKESYKTGTRPHVRRPDYLTQKQYKRIHQLWGSGLLSQVAIGLIVG